MGALQKNQEIGFGDLDTTAIEALVVVKLPKDRQSGSVVNTLDSVLLASHDIETLKKYCDNLPQSQSGSQAKPENARCAEAFLQNEFTAETADNGEGFQILSDFVTRPYLTEQEETLAASNEIIRSFLEKQFKNHKNDLKNYRVTWFEKNFQYALLLSYSARDSMASVLAYRVSL